MTHVNNCVNIRISLILGTLVMRVFREGIKMVVKRILVDRIMNSMNSTKKMDSLIKSIQTIEDQRRSNNKGYSNQDTHIGT